MLARISNFEKERVAAMVRRLEALALANRDVRWLLTKLKVKAISRGSRRGESRQIQPAHECGPVPLSARD
ncbi:MAG: hypothetical protein AB9869_02250 [Verrucomicrobiia bacterium]